jgi:hypothetical protein
MEFQNTSGARVNGRGHPEKLPEKVGCDDHKMTT